jgi:hypothetical protein
MAHKIKWGGKLAPKPIKARTVRPLKGLAPRSTRQGANPTGKFIWGLSRAMASDKSKSHTGRYLRTYAYNLAICAGLGAILILLVVLMKAAA